MWQDSGHTLIDSAGGILLWLLTVENRDHTVQEDSTWAVTAVDCRAMLPCCHAAGIALQADSAASALIENWLLPVGN